MMVNVGRSLLAPRERTALLARKNGPFLFLLLFIIVMRRPPLASCYGQSLVDGQQMDDTFEAKGAGSSMGLPYLTSFLWCMSLRVGSRIVSVMHFMFSAAMVLACAMAAHDASQYIGSEEDADRVYTQTFYVALGVAVVSVVHVVLSCGLFYGVFWRRPSVLRFWVLVMLVLYVVAVFSVILSAIVYGFSATGSDIFLNFFQALLVFAFIGYCILCVYSYYLMLRSAEDMNRPNKTDY